MLNSSTSSNRLSRVTEHFKVATLKVISLHPLNSHRKYALWIEFMEENEITHELSSYVWVLGILSDRYSPCGLFLTCYLPPSEIVCRRNFFLNDSNIKVYWIGTQKDLFPSVWYPSCYILEGYRLRYSAVDLWLSVVLWQNVSQHQDLQCAEFSFIKSSSIFLHYLQFNLQVESYSLFSKMGVSFLSIEDACVFSYLIPVFLNHLM